jgi:hypothetical protein
MYIFVGDVFMTSMDYFFVEKIHFVVDRCKFGI